MSPTFRIWLSGVNACAFMQLLGLWICHRRRFLRNKKCNVFGMIWGASLAILLGVDGLYGLKTYEAALAVAFTLLFLLMGWYGWEKPSGFEEDGRPMAVIFLIVGLLMLSAIVFSVLDWWGVIASSGYPY